MGSTARTGVGRGGGRHGQRSEDASLFPSRALMRGGETPQRPCEAYQIIARLVPDSYFEAEPPEAGMLLKAVHRKDGVVCQWFMEPTVARWVADKVGHSWSLSVLLEPYDDRGKEILEAG